MLYYISCHLHCLYRRFSIQQPAMLQSSMKTKRFLFILLAITAVALIVRTVICVQLFNAPDVQQPNAQTDMATYLSLAKDILAGKWPDHYDYQPFYYTIFLPVCLAIVSKSTILVMAVQTILGSLSISLNHL